MYGQKTIRVYNTHIEIFPYHLGECTPLEERLSYYDAVYHRRVYLGLYIEDDVLYIPKGINIAMLQSFFGTLPHIDHDSIDYHSQLGDYHINFKPRNSIQTEAINFLLTKDRFDKYRVHSQFGLNLDTGDGKTYCMINAIVHMNQKALIIVHKSRLKAQWIDEFVTMSDIPRDRIIDITGNQTIRNIMDDKIEGDIYVVNHQTIESYAKMNGWKAVKLFFQKIKIGIKVFDEAHKFFRDILMIDFFSNTYKTFYLTATFGRGDPKEYHIFKSSFSNLCRFGEETFNYDEKRKHINLLVVYYDSKPELGTTVQNGYGFSNYKFIDYALKYDPHKTILKVLKRILEQTNHLKGKTLITSPKIESVDTIAEFVSDWFDKPVGVVYSRNTKEENDNIISEKEIISTTIKSIGEGDNVKGLRVLINLDPIGSKGLADQLRGRLREYSKEDDTFLFYPVDLGFKECGDLFKRILPTMKKKCKSITFLRWMDL